MHTTPRAILAVLTIFLVAGCAHRAKIDQSTPQAGLLAFLDAIAAGDTATARRCVYVKPRHAKIADDIVELYAAEAVFHHAVNARFPGKDKGIFWDTFNDASIAEVRRHVEEGTIEVHGRKAVLKGISAESGPRDRLVHQDWHLVRDWGRWKLDYETVPPGDSRNWDHYPPLPDTDINLAMIFLLHESCPGLRQIAADVTAGKFQTVGEIKEAVEKEASVSNKRVYEKLNRVAKAQSSGPPDNYRPKPGQE